MAMHNKVTAEFGIYPQQNNLFLTQFWFNIEDKRKHRAFSPPMGGHIDLNIF